jgi:rhodanese-related sulfurtransferase
LNKEHLPCFAAILIMFPMFSLIGLVAENNNQDHFLEYQNVTVNEAYKMVIKNALVPNYKVFILDVRTPAEYNYTHIEGANLIPLRNVPLHDPVNLSDERLLAWHIKNNKDLPKSKDSKILVYCFSGKRSAVASEMLVQSGYKRVYNMQSGIIEWVNARYPIVIDPIFWTVNYPKVV